MSKIENFLVTVLLCGVGVLLVAAYLKSKALEQAVTPNPASSLGDISNVWTKAVPWDAQNIPEALSDAQAAQDSDMSPSLFDRIFYPDESSAWDALMNNGASPDAPTVGDVGYAAENWMSQNRFF